MLSDRDVEKSYTLPEFAAELRRLANALEAGEQFSIEIDGEEVVVPQHATVSIEHERDEGCEEIEFQLVWETDDSDDDDDDVEDDDDIEDESDIEDEAAA